MIPPETPVLPCCAELCVPIAVAAAPTVAKGDASDEEKKELHAMLVSMSKNKPPKGEQEAWDKLTAALVKAGKAAVEGDGKAAGMLKKAANCKACHSVHKP